MAAITPQPFVPGARLIDGTDLNKAFAAQTYSVDNGATATGNTRATAYKIGATLTVFSTVAASTGAVLPTNPSFGVEYFIFNAGASPLTVYGAGSATIDGVAGATGVPLANAKRCAYIYVALNTWISAQLGVVSA